MVWSSCYRRWGHRCGWGLMATTLPRCGVLGSGGADVTTNVGAHTREVTGVEPAPRPGREGAGGPCGDTTRMAAGWGVPGAPGKRNRACRESET